MIKIDSGIIQRLRQNSIFRLSLLYMGLFFISSVFTAGLSYYTIKKNIKLSVEREVNAEITRYIGSYQSNQLGITPSQYAFFIEQDGQKIAGNLSKIPETKNNSLSEVQAKISKTIEEFSNHKDNDTLVNILDNKSVNNKVDLIGKTVEVGNTKLFIGKNNYDTAQQQHDILDALVSSMVILLLIGTVGGLLISYQATKRINKISKISKSIMRGDLSLRIPKSKYNDDIEDLTGNLNLMLDKINDLMQNVRQVSNNIAHDLRTPLTRLRGHIETISNLSDIKSSKLEAENAIIEIDSILSTFSALLRISYIESGSANLHVEEIDISNLIDELVDFYEVLAEDKQQTISVFHGENIKVMADREMLIQAIINILTNAIKYTPENGKITIVTKSVGDNVVINIKDNGSGVPEGVLSKLTERFYRLDEHRTSNEGNGLGLSLVKAIVEYHKGKLKIYNDDGLNVEITLSKSTC